MKKTWIHVALVLLATMAGGSIAANAQEQRWSVRTANAAMERWPDGRFAPAGAKWTWNYELGTLLRGIDSVWFSTADGRYFKYIKASVDQFVNADGTIPTYNAEENQLDSILLGRQLLLLYGVTRDARYAKAATVLYQQLKQQPRTPSGGFWHKQRYPNQMWQDGLYMAEPFYAEYAATFHHPEDFADITHQFVLIDEHTRDAKTGLLYHGWDESKQERWANKETGDSSQFWARAMGWTMMALMDTIPYYPEGDPGRKQLIAIFERDAAAVAKYQGPDSGVWYQIMDKKGAKGNYLESSASGMFVYALARGVRQGFLPASYLANAERGYKGMQTQFVKTGPGDSVSLGGTVKVGGLGGDPYRDGSYEYYLSEKVVTDDPKGVGPFILASNEIEHAETAKLGRGDTVVVDAWFNSQKHADAFGQQELFHYKWNDQSNDGYSLLGHTFRNFGAETKTLTTEPTVDALKKAQVYIIASPDTVAKNPNPHFVNAEDGAQIAEWVKGGGVLMLFANDPANTDLEHFNLIAERFGIHFNSVLKKHVIEDAHELGMLKVPGGGEIFHDPHTLFMKDVCNLSVQGAAKAAFQDEEGILMATAKYGKGTVFVTVDPWLYNEYTDGRKLQAPYDNFAGGGELVRWVLAQVPAKAAEKKQ